MIMLGAELQNLLKLFEALVEGSLKSPQLVTVQSTEDGNIIY